MPLARCPMIHNCRSLRLWAFCSAFENDLLIRNEFSKHGTCDYKTISVSALLVQGSLIKIRDKMTFDHFQVQELHSRLGIFF